MSVTTDEMMMRMGFPPGETGPFVTELRAKVAKQIEGGMTNRSGGSWAPGNHSYETKARELLAVDWAIEHGHSYRVECMDGVESVRDVPAWLGDRAREAAMDVKIAADKLLGRTNPYTAAPTPVGAA